MEKELFSKVFIPSEGGAENANCTSDFLKALQVNDRSVGTSAQLAQNDTIKLVKFDYIDGKRTIGEDAYAELPEDSAADRSAKRRYVRNADGSYTVDNSYYAVITEGAVQAVSFRTLTSGAALKTEAPEGCNFLVSGGRASDVAKSLAPYIGKTLKVVKVRPWEKGQTVNGREQQFAGRAVFFAVEGETAADKKKNA